jgi:hypothetical protein
VDFSASSHPHRRTTLPNLITDPWPARHPVAPRATRVWVPCRCHAKRVWRTRTCDLRLRRRKCYDRSRPLSATCRGCHAEVPCRLLGAIAEPWSSRQVSLVSSEGFAYAGGMYATAIADGKVVRFKLSSALARAHRENRQKAMTEREAVAFVEQKRRQRALRRARPYLAGRPLTPAF